MIRNRSLTSYLIVLTALLFAACGTPSEPENTMVALQASANVSAVVD